MTTYRLLETLVVLCLVLAAPAQADEAARKPLKITFIGNSGYMLETENHKVIIDGLFRAGFEGLMSIPAEYRDTLEGGKPPFDGVELVLVTLNQPDHFEPFAVGNYLKNTPGATLISTPEVIKKLEVALVDYDKIHEQVGGFAPQTTPVLLPAGEIDLQVFSLDSTPGASALVMAFIIEMDGWKIFHGGDGVVTKPVAESLNLIDGAVDVAFIPYWFVANELLEITVSAMATRSMIITHMPPAADPMNYLEPLGGREKILESFKAANSSALLMEEQFSSIVLD